MDAMGGRTLPKDLSLDEFRSNHPSTAPIEG
jgi:hypothetical protein